MELKDNLGRRINYLRLSITDRCNLRCGYCMPEDGFVLCRHEDVLSLEEFAEASEKFVRLFGIDKIRITGGEPLIKRNIEYLIRRIVAIPGLRDIGLTTNGILLKEKGQAVYDAGIRRVNISLDSLNPELYKKITRIGNLDDALEGIEAGKKLGFNPIKINTVLLPGFNEEIELIEWANENGFTLRFIELMDSLQWQSVNNGKTPRMPDIISRLEKIFGKIEPIKVKSPVDGNHTIEFLIPDKNWRFEFIPAMSNHFCMSCNRIRLNCEGLLRFCLFSNRTLQIRDLLKRSDEEFITAIQQFVNEKSTVHHDCNINAFMHSIGG